MAQTLTRFIFFASGDLHVIVNAASDDDLAPHIGPPGAVFVDVPTLNYQKSQLLRDQMALGQPLVAAKDAVVGAAITAKIQAIDAAAAAASAVDAPVEILP